MLAPSLEMAVEAVTFVLNKNIEIINKIRKRFFLVQQG